DLAIEDSAGNGFKANGIHDLILRRVRAEWTHGPSTKNGAYGLYPVQTQNLLIEDCVVKGASDAGIYVGQSKNLVVRTTAPSSTSPASRSRTPSTPTSTATPPPTTPAASWSSTCPTSRCRAAARGCSATTPSPTTPRTSHWTGRPCARCRRARAY